MDSFDIEEVRARMTELVTRAADGQSFIISVKGKPVACITMADEAAYFRERRIGFLAGEFSVPSDFDQIGQAQVTEMFEGKSERADEPR